VILAGARPGTYLKHMSVRIDPGELIVGKPLYGGSAAPILS